MLWENTRNSALYRIYVLSNEENLTENKDNAMEAMRFRRNNLTHSAHNEKGHTHTHKCAAHVFTNCTYARI